MSTYDGNSTTSPVASDDTEALIDAHARRVQRRAGITTIDPAARREDRRKRLIRRKAVEGNELRFALDEAARLRHFQRAAVA